MSGYQVSLITVAVFDTKPYDRKARQQVSADHGMDWHFLDFRLTQNIASASKNARVACVFVNDRLNWPYLEIPARHWVILVAFRSIGVNYLGIDGAGELALTVTRVPVYSPYAVAEHAVALPLTGACGAVDQGGQ
jgi:D-lactate dehydrogenase